MKITVNCQVCNKEFSKYPSQKKTFCSCTCSNKSRGFYYKNQVKCEWCGKKINRPSPSKTHKFCSKKCEMDFKRKDRIEIECVICHKKMKVQPSQKNRKYCSRKCMGVDVRKRMIWKSPQYRSYGECAIMVLLKKNYPDIDFIPNDRIQLNGFEIDIWIPLLKTGVEYNGQHHFKPVYGDKVFKKTRMADMSKYKLAKQKEINLVYVIPDGSVSKTSITKIKNMFLTCCKNIGLPIPTILEFTKDEVINEQNRR